MTTERQFKDLETQIARCTFLEQDVTDPLAACLVHLMILELEADPRIVGPETNSCSVVGATDAIERARGRLISQIV